MGFFDSFWRLFSLVHVFLSPLKFPMGLYIKFLVLLECISLLPRGVHWRNFHIRRLVYFFPSFLVVFRICFLILIRIYLLYLCCSNGPSHSVWWSLFVWVFFRRLSRIFAVTIRWSVDTPSKEEYASQFIALFFHFLFIRTYAGRAPFLPARRAMRFVYVVWVWVMVIFWWLFYSLL